VSDCLAFCLHIGTLSVGGPVCRSVGLSGPLPKLSDSFVPFFFFRSLFLSFFSVVYMKKRRGKKKHKVCLSLWVWVYIYALAHVGWMKSSMGF